MILCKFNLIFFEYFTGYFREESFHQSIKPWYYELQKKYSIHISMFFIYVFVRVIYVSKIFKGCFSDCLYIFIRECVVMNVNKLRFVNVTSFYLLF